MFPSRLPRILLCATTILSLTTICSAEPVIRQGDVLTVCGDSITQMGLYSVFIEDYIRMCQPVRDVKIIQCGWGGTTAPHLADHMRDGVLTFSPTIATICYGMNDAHASLPPPAIDASYRNGLVRIIDNFRKAGTRTVVVGSPGAVDTWYFKNPRIPTVTGEQYNVVLGRLAGIAREVAAEKGMPFADLHTPMVKTMVKAKAALGQKYGVFGTADGVHSSPNGHLIMAYAFLKGMGFDGNIGTITYDAASGAAIATEGQRILSSGSGSVTIKSTRYPYCFTHGDDHPTGPVTGILPFLPFNEELNRYTLVVKNLGAPSAMITWGAESKKFSAADLAKGINLAANFLKNPFVPAFSAVDRAVSAKNDFEILAVTFYMGQQLPGLRAALPDQTASFAQIDSGFRKVDAALQDECAAAVKPVTHTIKIQPLN